MSPSVLSSLSPALAIPVALLSSLTLLAGDGADGPPNLLTCSLWQQAD